MARRRVVVTGLGAVTPLGIGAKPLHERWAAGDVGIVDGAGTCTDFEPKEFFSVKEIRRLDRFDRRRRFAPWLGAIVANRAIDWTRARAARRESQQEPPEPVARPDAPTGRYSDEVMAALATLTPEHRAVVVLRFVLEYTPGEIARTLDLPRGTVNSRLRRGLDALKEHLTEADPR